MNVVGRIDTAIGNFLAILGLCVSILVAWVQSLVEELRSQQLGSMAKRKKKKKKKLKKAVKKINKQTQL